MTETPLPGLKDPRVQLSGEAPLEFMAANGTPFDIIDISGEFLGQAFANRFAFTTEGMGRMLGNLKPDGVLSIPVSVQEFTVYAVKTIETARAALAAHPGVDDPARHMIIYRSAWNVRILLSPTPFAAERVEALLAWFDERSFDPAYFHGIADRKISVWNDLPRVDFESGTVAPSGPDGSDALREQTLELLAGGAPYLEAQYFDLRAVTHDRPFNHYIIRPGNLGGVLERIMMLPREVIGYLVNVAVLGQSILIAMVVMFLPLLRWRRQLPKGGLVWKALLYFSALGLGFLFIEILLIEKVSYLLNDSTSAFAVVLAGMLIFSGLGSYLCVLTGPDSRRTVRRAAVVIVVWCLLAWLTLDGVVEVILGWPHLLKILAVLVLLAPVSIALGMPFPLGLGLLRGDRATLLPWAWSLNGAFSVISTPLATLVAVSMGYASLLLGAVVLYGFVYLLYPADQN